MPINLKKAPAQALEEFKNTRDKLLGYIRYKGYKFIDVNNISIGTYKDSEETFWHYLFIPLIINSRRNNSILVSLREINELQNELKEINEEHSRIIFNIKNGKFGLEIGIVAEADLFEKEMD